MVEKLTLWSPQKLLKILAHSPNTLMQPTLDQNKKIEILLSIMDTMEKWSKNHLTLLSLYILPQYIGVTNHLAQCIVLQKDKKNSEI